jgi:hypothetical protein
MLLFYEMGYTVSKPFGDNCQYDILVDTKEDGIKKIQVKSTSCMSLERPLGYYNVSTARGSAKKILYTKGTIDYFAIYIIPVNAYYLIPAELITGRTIKLYPHRKTTNKFEKYRLK